VELPAAAGWPGRSPRRSPPAAPSSVKPSEFTSASTFEFAELFDEAGFPPGVFNVVTGFGA
jgi:hypothetical protein